MAKIKMKIIEEPNFAAPDTSPRFLVTEMQSADRRILEAIYRRKKDGPSQLPETVESDREKEFDITPGNVVDLWATGFEWEPDAMTQAFHLLAELVRDHPKMTR